MPVQLVKSVNFAGRASLTDVGYMLLDESGTIVTARTTSGVSEIGTSGIYTAIITFPDGFRGNIMWDTGSSFAKTYFAAEQHNPEENTATVSATLAPIVGTLQLLKNMTMGRWKIDNNHMSFYAEDNVTLIAKYALYDDTGTLSSETVFERLKV